MTSDSKTNHPFFEAVRATITYGGPAHGIEITNFFSKAAEHVCVPLRGAMEAFWRESFSRSVFLAITSVEEAVEAEILAFPTAYSAEERPGRGPMRDHASKHRLAVYPITFMDRLPRLLGREWCIRLRGEMEAGELVDARERACYFQFDTSVCSFPPVCWATDQRANAFTSLLKMQRDAQSCRSS